MTDTTTDKIHDPYNPTRTITLWPSPEWLDTAIRGTGGKVMEAVGYLVTYAPRTYPAVTIHTTSDDHDMVAVFHDPDNADRKFVIGAIWRVAERKYSFHS